MGADLFLYNRDKCRIVGIDNAFIAGPRLDDLECAFAGMAALVKEEPKEYVNVCAVFDNEEVGSGTKQGADSTFLKDVLSGSVENSVLMRRNIGVCWRTVF